LNIITASEEGQLVIGSVPTEVTENTWVEHEVQLSAFFGKPKEATLAEKS
jgi:hypothetical protein